MPLSLPVLAGPLRGARWIPASGGKILRVFAGTYEPEQTGWFTKLIKPGDVVLDVGAHVGYYTLLASRLTGPSGCVISFEPDPGNHRHLCSHVRLNRAANVEVVRSAVGDQSGTARFRKGTGSGTGHLAGSGDLEVPVLRLDDFLETRDVHPGFLKIDTEGAEGLVLRGSRLLLERDRPVIFLSTHGADRHRDALSLLSEAGYSFQAILGGSPEAASEVLCRPRP